MKKIGELKYCRITDYSTKRRLRLEQSKERDNFINEEGTSPLLNDEVQINVQQ